VLGFFVILRTENWFCHAVKILQAWKCVAVCSLKLNNSFKRDITEQVLSRSSYTTIMEMRSRIFVEAQALT